MTQSSNADPLIARQNLFGNPMRAMVRVSPVGGHLAWLAPLDGVLNVWVAPLDDIGGAKAITNDTSRGIRAFGWSWDGRFIAYVQDKAGDENWHLYAVAREGGEARNLTPLEGVQARQVAASHKHPDTIIVGLNDRDPAWHDLYRVSVSTGAREPLLTNTNELSGFSFDQDLNLRIVTRTLADGGAEYLRYLDGETESLRKVPYEDALSSGVRGLEADGVHLQLITSVGRDTAALTRLNLLTGEEEMLGEDEQADVGDVLAHPISGIAEAYAVNYLKKQWRPLGASVKRDLAMFEQKFPNGFRVASRDRESNIWLVVSSSAKDPGYYHLYNRTDQTWRALFSIYPQLDDAPLRSMHPVVIPSRDELNLVSYLTLPGATEPVEVSAREGQIPEAPAEPGPMVLLVHGGPWGRDYYGFNPLHQWLADRGYAVLSVNFRGSTGFGKAFTNAGDNEWAGRMHDDLMDAVAWAVSNGFADRERIAIMGGSYGGYATLVGLTFTPEAFACGVDIVGPSNLETLLATVPPYWKAFFENLARRVGDPRTQDGVAQLQARSPLYKADEIVRPLLIGQGANDPRVKQAESDQIVGAMEAKGLPVTYVLYPDEGHGFARPENRISFNAIVEQFLAAHLGGAVEPIGGDFDGASLTVPNGSEHLAGLAEALPEEAGGA